MTGKSYTIIVGTLLLALLVFAFYRSSDPATSGRQRLDDGSTLELRQVILATNISYSYRPGSRLQQFLAPVIPEYIKSRFWPSGNASFGGGGTGATNLWIVTLHRHSAQPARLRPTRLTIFDQSGNSYDAAWGAHTLGFSTETVNGWQVHAFPRRSEMLGLRFWGPQADRSWTNLAEFSIRNPAFGEFPQWIPEAIPVAKEDRDLRVTLQEFQSGSPWPFRSNDFVWDKKTIPRKTRMALEFVQAGQMVTNWQVQKLTISDATGNRWSPFLVRQTQGISWTTNGVVELFGALWPEEHAWKLEFELNRSSDFAETELWQSSPVAIPIVGVATNLNSGFERDGITVQLAGLAAPQADQPDPFKWIAKYWGNDDKDKVISLAVKISPNLGGRRLKLIRAVDQNGSAAELVQHNGEDYSEQALLLKRADGARQLKFTFALQRSRFAQFLARPDSVESKAPTHGK